MSNDNSPKRVDEWEISGLNPGKQFLTDFTLANCKHVHNTPIKVDDLEEIGADAARLVEIVMSIRGVNSVSISKEELRVFKKATHTWEELTPKIREAFKTVYDDNFKFSWENPIILWARRLRVELKS